MPNVFDQFDEATEPEQANPFDQFDKPQAPDLSGVKPSPYEKVYLETGMLDPGMQAGTEFTAATQGGLPGIMAAAGEAILKPVGRMTADVINQLRIAEAPSSTLLTGKQEIEPIAFPGKPIGPPLPLAAPEFKGVVPSLSRAVDALRTPETIGALAVAPLAPEAVASTFMAQVPQAFQSGAQSLATAKTPAEVRGALTDLALTEIMRRTLTKGERYAGGKQEAAAIHGDVRAQPVEGAREVPVEKGGAGVQPQAPGRVEKAAQVLLTLEEKQLIETERKSIDAPDIEFEAPEAVDQPFATRRLRPGEIASIDPTKGTIVVDPQLMREWLQRDVPPDQRPQAVRSLLAEEKNHLQAKKTITDEEASDFWGNLTALERTAHTRRYTGEWSREVLERSRGVTFSDAQMGHEAINSFMMRAARMPLREFVEATGREKWTVATLDNLANMMFKVRKSLGTKASAEQVAILDRIDANIGAALTAAGATPGAFKKQEGQSEIERVSKLDAAQFNQYIRSEGRGLTGNAYRLGEQVRTSDVPALEAARDAAAAERKRIMAEPGKSEELLNRAATSVLKRQYFQEAIQWRKALDEARKRDATILDDFSEIEREFGVGGAGRPGQDLRLAFDREESARATEPFDEKTLPPVEKGLVRLYNGSQAGSGVSNVWWTRNAAKASTFGENIRYVDVPSDAVMSAKLKAMEAGKGGDTHMLEDIYVRSSHPAGKYEAPAHEIAAEEPKGHRDGVIEGLKLGDEDVPRIEQLKNQAQSEMEKAFADNDSAKAAEAFGRFNYYGGQLEGATRSGPNFERYMAEVRGQPAAFKKQRKGQPQPELFLPPARAVGEAAKPVERPGAVELGAEAVTPAKLESSASEFLKTSEKPSFKGFVEEMTRRYGDLKPGQVRDLWTESVWKNLEGATGQELAAMRERLGLTETLGRDPIPDAPSRQALLQGQMPKDVAEGVRKANVARQRHRGYMVTKLGQELLRQVVPAKRALRRSSITTDDIAYGRDTQEPAYNEISGPDASNLPVLSSVLVQDARSSGYKVSETKRLSVIVDKTTGQTHVVSTFADPRRGTVLVDPVAPKGTHVPLERLMPRYRVVASVLLDEPVQNFKQTFKSLRDYQNAFGAEARARFSQSQTMDVPPVEGEFMPGPTTGKVATPGVYQQGPGVLTASARRPITEPEAAAVIDQLLAEVDRFDSPEDVKLAWVGLSEERNLAAISAYRKMAAEIARKNPQMTGEEVLNRLAQQVYETYQTAKTGDEFISRTMAQGRPTTGEPVQVVPTAPPAGQELTMLSRRPPTAVAGQQLPAGPGPTPTMEPSAPVERLSPEAQRFVAGRSTEPQPQPPYREIAEPLKIAGKPKDVVITSRPQFAMKRGEGVVLGPKTATVPAAFRKSLQTSKDVARGTFDSIKDAIKAGLARRGTFSDITRWRDAADNTSRIYARNAGDSIRVETINPGLLNTIRRAARAPGGVSEKLAAFQQYRKQAAETAVIRNAAKAVIAAAGDKAKLPDFLKMIEQGRAKANQLLKDRPGSLVARRWLAAADKLKEEVEYAQAHWNDPNLRQTADVAKKELADEFAFEKDNGINLREAPDYIPGRYDADMFNDHSITFGDMRILGRRFRDPKTFANYYEAIANGPYIAKNLDVADLVEHRVRQGRMEVNKRLWLERLKNVRDPATGQPIVKEPVETDAGPRSPGPEYEPFRMHDVGKLTYVRHGYKDLMHVLTMQSGLAKSPVTKIMLHATGMAKHGAILILDTFHPFRLGQYTLGMSGLKAGYRGGLSALEYRESAIPKAIENGYITQESANWAAKKIKLKMPAGNEVEMTRRQILDIGVSEGLNVGRLTDALYMDLTRKIPISGALNKFTFDQFTRGLMAESYVRAVEKLNQAHPDIPMYRHVKSAVKDINTYYASLGRQGFIRNPTIRDLSQLIFLAPQWVEGLIQKEVRFGSRLAMAPYRMARGEVVLGPLGAGMARGLLGYFVLTQVLNLITRRQFTFQNEEEGHKLDAFIPTGENSGFWLSPMSVFAEVAHDFIRLGETKPTVWEGIRQVGANKLGPWGRMWMVLATREDPFGERLTSTPAIIRTAAGQLLPTPISLSAPGRALGHAILPSTVSPPRPGALQRQALAAVGIKVQPAGTRVQGIRDLAQQWMKREGIPTPAIFIQPTDEPSYYKLRRALQNDDMAGARRMMAALREKHTDDQINKAMEMWSKRPFTGSEEHEGMFLQSLDERELDQYFRANMERQEVFNKFVDFYLKN